MVTRESMDRESESPGEVALSFLNAPDIAGWLATVTFESIADAGSTGLVADRALLSEAERLRHHLGRLLSAISDGRAIPTEAVYVLNRALAHIQRGTQVKVSEELLRAESTVVAPGPLASLGLIAESAARLVSEHRPNRLRTCASPDCAQWFVDTSKGGRRRWCSMSRCGNRAKAARFRERHGS